MPRYDFQCPSCGEIGEVTIALADKDTTVVECPECFDIDEDGCHHHVVMEQVWAAPGFKFKGRGWTPKFGPR